MEYVENSTKVNRDLFCDRVVDANNHDFGFVKNGIIYTYLTTSKNKAKGEPWLRMQKTGEVGKDRRKYLLFFANETEASAYVDKYNDIYDFEDNYIASILKSRFIIFFIAFIILGMLFTGAIVWLGGSMIMDTSQPYNENNSFVIEDNNKEDLIIEEDVNIFDENNNQNNKNVYEKIKEITNKEENKKEEENEQTYSGDISTDFEEQHQIHKIYPGYKSSYYFCIKNEMDTSVYSRLYLSEDNNYNIPIKYKLIYNGKYISGDKDSWVSIDDIELYPTYLKAGDTAKYELQWMWDPDVDDAYDTSLGINAIAEYILNIKVIYETAY